jgi:hypothetical protein
MEARPQAVSRKKKGDRAVREEGDTQAMDDQTQTAFDERIRWINQVTDLAKDGNLKAVWQAIEDVDDEHLRSLILVLVLSRVDDFERIKAHHAEWMTERLNEWPLASDN